MVVYLDVIILLNFLVDFFLLMGTNRLCGYPARCGRSALAAAVGGVYGGVCLLPGFRFLGSTLWRVISLCLISILAFGFYKNAVRRGAIFTLLNMALGGVALGLGTNGFWTIVISAIGVALICVLGFPGKIGGASYVPVELSYGNNNLRLIALQDTGNSLTDPLTGRSVLVIGADAAQRLTGLTREQLCKPSEAILSAGVPGLRLIPYRTIGQPGGMLLGMRFQNVRIGKWKGSSLVAFAPEGLSEEGSYQALTGGVA